MNILHISPYVPDVHANHAGGVCMGKQVETLKKYHQVTVLTFVNDAHEKELIKKHPDYYYVETSKMSFIRNVLLHPMMPNMFAIRNDKAYKRKFIQLVKEKNIDAIHAEFTSMGQYVWIKKMFPHIKFNLTEHDVTIQSYERQVKEAKGIKKLYVSIEKNKVLASERKYLQEVDTVMTFNAKDRELLKHKYALQNVVVLNPYYGLEFNEHPKVEKEMHSICFVGQMGRDENHVAAMRLISIFKKINHQNWKLNIIGAHPKDELKREECNNIHISGFVDDINAEILKNEIAVFPLTYGAGIKLKVLLACGLGLPVVTSKIGAEGIDESGSVLQLAENDEEYIKIISDLLSNPNKVKNLSEKSIVFVKEKFSWEVSEKILKDIYK